MQPVYSKGSNTCMYFFFLRLFLKRLHFLNWENHYVGWRIVWFPLYYFVCGFRAFPISISSSIRTWKRFTAMTEKKIYSWRRWTQICRGFKAHDLITCESKVQVVVSQGNSWVLFALGSKSVFTHGTWYVLVQSYFPEVKSVTWENATFP